LANEPASFETRLGFAFAVLRMTGNTYNTFNNLDGCQILTPNPSPKGRGAFSTLSRWERVPSAEPRAGEGMSLKSLNSFRVRLSG
jgi:hypothetical protein